MTEETNCPGCKQAPNTYRQGKGREHLCGWCGYNHATGEQAQLVPASIEGSFSYAPAEPSYPMFERVDPEQGAFTALPDHEATVVTFYSGPYITDKLSPGWVIRRGHDVDIPPNAAFVSIRPALAGEEAMVTGDLVITSTDTTTAEGTPIRRLRVSPAQGNAIIAHHRAAEEHHEVHGHNRPVDPADVLAFVNDFTSCEDDDNGTTLAFVQEAAKMIADGKTYRDFGMAGYAGFVEWCDERMRESHPLSFRYTNYRGETAVRIVSPIRIIHGATPWHPETQWLLEAVCHDRREVRAFPLTDLRFHKEPLYRHPVTGEELTAFPRLLIDTAREDPVISDTAVAWAYLRADDPSARIVTLNRWPEYRAPAGNPERVSRFREYPLYAAHPAQTVEGR